MPTDIDAMLNPFKFLVRQYPYPPEVELFYNANLLLFTLFVYVTSFVAGFHIVTLSSYVAMCIYGYCIYNNLRDLNLGWEKRRAEEAETEGDETEEAEEEAVDEDAAKEEVPSETESEDSLEEGEIREDRRPTDLQVSDDSQDEELPPLIPASEVNWIHHVD